MGHDTVNNVFEQTSFLYGANAPYVEDLYAKYQENPDNVDAQWREFFSLLQDDPGDARQSVKGASWKKAHWPATPGGEWVNAIDGRWPAVEKEISDKIKGKAATQ